ncbi:MAG: CaiB/BaiF CoA transferase family protein [Deltaproteobacteria bacterium]|nr:CoA transferase [Candidatus Deferrimicrobiaceae bacterium]
MSRFADWAREASDPGKAASRPEALPGLRVLELCPGHFGGMVAASILSEFGADVVKVEPPGGDPARRYAPEGISIAGTGLPFLSEGRNRRFATLSLEKEEGRKIFRRMAAGADVIVTSENAARLEEAGMGYRSLSAENPHLVFLALSTYGSYGPDAERRVKDSDVLCQALSGAPYIVGEPEGEEGNGPAGPHQAPTRLGNWHAWFVEGMWGAFGVLAALHFRADTGKGQFVDVSGAEGLMKFVDYNITWMHTAGMARERTGNFDPAVFPYTYIRCRDGHTFIAAYNDEAFESLMNIIGRPELARDPRFVNPTARVQMENEKALLSILEEWSGNLSADEILRAVEDYTSKKSGPGAAVVTGRVNRPLETIAEANWWERGCFARAADPVYGDLLLAAPPWKMSGTPARIKSVCRLPGADNRKVYAELGFSSAEIDSLGALGII